MTKFTQTYPTDLQYTKWLLIVQFFPPPKRGRSRQWELGQIINASLYVTRTGCQWRMLPKDMPPWQTVYGYFWRWTKSGVWATINAALVRQVHQTQGRDSKPSAAIIDSQSVKTSEGGYACIGARVRKQFGWTLEIVKAPTGQKGFKVLPRRWGVERAFGWLGRYRRLARDYEHTVSSSEAMTYLASVRRMLKLATN